MKKIKVFTISLLFTALIFGNVSCSNDSDSDIENETELSSEKAEFEKARYITSNSNHCNGKKSSFSTGGSNNSNRRSSSKDHY